MHSNLRQPDAAPVPICFNFVAYAKFEVAHPIRYRLVAFSLLTRYLAVKLCTKFERNRANPRRSYCDLSI